MIRRPRSSTPFPSPPLFRSSHTAEPHHRQRELEVGEPGAVAGLPPVGRDEEDPAVGRLAHARSSRARRQDRKSTRLNSSHSQISYAVFCLKKKKCTSYNTLI